MVDALVSIALEKLTSVLGQQMGQQIDQKMKLFVGATHELKRLKDTFESIGAVLADAESKQVEEKSAQLWLSRLRNVSYDIEDLLNDYLLLSAHDNDDTNDSDDDSCTCYSCLDDIFNYGVTRYKLACDVKEIRRRLDDIAKDKGQFNSGIQRSINFNFEGEVRPVSRSRTMTSSYMNEEMIGRDDDLETVINWLLSGSSNSIDQEDGLLQQRQQVQVVAIVGIGGLGKTTLARKIYHDREVQDHFKEFLYWVCVSQDFDLKRLLKAIIEQVTGKGTSLTELDSLQRELIRTLTGKRFLLVLDDVWNIEKRKWNALKLCLAIGVLGSRILVTTRLRMVVKDTMNAVHIHELKGLSDDHSWTLFKNIAFEGQTEKEYYDQLECVGRQIVRKCEGVPLSITVMGSMLNSKRTVKDWQNIFKSQIWSLQEAQNIILPALWLSYYNLPPHLKQCFVFCSIYAEDEAMPKDELVGMWIAQGFVQSQGNRELEVIGAEYADDLVAWSMLQEQVNDGQTRYTMHDLLHDLAKFIAKGEIYHSIGSEVEMLYKFPTDNVRHAILNFNWQNSISPTSINAKKLRTLRLGNVAENIIEDLLHQARFLRSLSFCPSREVSKAICKLKHLRYLDLSWSWINDLPISFGKLNQLSYLNLANSRIVMLPDSIGKLNQLRYLNLAHSEIVKLPDSIGKLNQLRYLNLARSKIVKLPDSIGKLKQLSYLDSSLLKILELPESVNHLSNLHTLKLCGCHELERLPRQMDKMVNLRYLDNEGTSSLKCLPQGLGRISCLQSLCKFIVGGEGGCGIHELQGLNALEESLEIEHLERVPSKEEAEKAELWNKKKLRRLILQMSDATAVADVLEGLRPHVNLEELRLMSSYVFSKPYTAISNLKLPSWIEDSSFSKLTRLVVDGFNNYCEPKILPGIGKLPALKYLELHSVSIKKLGHEFYYGNDSSNKNSCGLISSSAAFPKLEELYLIFLEELKEWELPIMTTVEGDNAIVEVINIMPHLSKLMLFHCSKLEVLPRHLATSPLKSLEIYESSRIKTRECFSSFRLLENFTWSECGEFLSGVLPNLPKMKTFTISGLENERLAEEGWEQLESLEDLTIRKYLQLDSVPEGLRQLKKLKSLKLYLLRELRHLPYWLGELESLECLDIMWLHKLESLPHLSLGQLKELKTLQIEGCEALASLPDGLQHLSCLQSLTIKFCPLLSERCERDGVDWPKISHIPNLIIH